LLDQGEAADQAGGASSWCGTIERKRSEDGCPTYHLLQPRRDLLGAHTLLEWPASHPQAPASPDPSSS
jgi:hypothetical protein